MEIVEKTSVHLKRVAVVPVHPPGEEVCRGVRQTAHVHRGVPGVDHVGHAVAVAVDAVAAGGGAGQDDLAGLPGKMFT